MNDEVVLLVPYFWHEYLCSTFGKAEVRSQEDLPEHEGHDIKFMGSSIHPRYFRPLVANLRLVAWWSQLQY